jgi:hypothetical protein
LFFYFIFSNAGLSGVGIRKGSAMAVKGGGGGAIYIGKKETSTLVLSPPPPLSPSTPPGCNVPLKINSTAVKV